MSAEQRAREWRRAQGISDEQMREAGLWIDKLLAAYASEREAQYNCDVCGKELPPDKWMQCAECAEKVEAELARARQEGREESFSALRWIRDQVSAIPPEHPSLKGDTVNGKEIARRFDEILKAYGVFFNDKEMRSRLIIDLMQKSVPAQAHCQKCGKPKSGPWTTLCTAAVQDPRYMEMYCKCIDSFTVLQSGREGARFELLFWAVERWRAEVANRPLINIHRRSLDDTWRQVIRYAQGDPDVLLGPDHDSLLEVPAETAPQQKDNP
jgi:uncharacterized OB-fold protein